MSTCAIVPGLPCDYTVVLWSILFRAESAGNEALVADLWDKGTAGIIEQDDGLRAFFDDSVTQREVVDLAGPVEVEVRDEPLDGPPPRYDDWDPLLVGERFYITTPWIKLPTPVSRLRLEIDAADAFGTGRHETTQLCLEALEKYAAAHVVAVDIGCGSGILSAAAKLLGVNSVFSCDIHYDAIVRTKRQTAVPVFLGSTDAVQDRTADLVLANISARVLDRLAGELRRITKPDGRLIVSGFVRERTPEHYQPEIELERDSWLCWICRQQGIKADERQTDEALEHAMDWWL